MIISYAQNFEDVMLWRALSHVENGFYIDVGAQHPVVDSVSKLFYERGWRGIHVEPTERNASLLRADRPDEIVLQAALSHTKGALPFYEIPETGLSTAHADTAHSHRQRGFHVDETIVPSTTLADVFQRAGPRDIHWLKIDVEGFEKNVLRGWGQSKARPWLVVIESTIPLTQIESHLAWEAILLRKGYTATYYDGLNRFYLSTQHPELAAAFKAPPNVFDGFALSGSASSSFCSLVNDRLAAANTEVTQTAALLAQQNNAALRSSQALQKAQEQIGLLDKAAADYSRETSRQLLHARRETHRLGNFLSARDKLIADLQTEQRTLHLELQRERRDARQRATDFASEVREYHNRIADFQSSIEERTRLAAQELAQLQIEYKAMQSDTLERAHREATRARELEASKAELSRLTSELEVSNAELSRLTSELEASKTELSHLKVALDTEARSLERAELLRQAVLQDAHRRATEFTEREGALLGRLTDTWQRVSVVTHELASKQEQVNALHHQLGESDTKCQELSRDLDHAHTENQQLLLQAEAFKSAGRALFIDLTDLQSNLKRRLLPWARIQNISSLTRGRVFVQDAVDSAHANQTHRDHPSADFHAAAWQDLAKHQRQQREFHALEFLPKQLDDFLLAIYSALLRRDPDPQGASYYRARLLAGYPKIAIVGDIRYSPEGQRLAPKVSGLRSRYFAFKLTRFLPFGRPLARLLAPFFDPRVRAFYRLSDFSPFDGPAFIDVAYRAILDRPPDPAGLAYYIQRLNTGSSKIRILSALRYSPEGRRSQAYIAGLALHRYLDRVRSWPLIGFVFRPSGVRKSPLHASPPAASLLRASPPQTIENPLHAVAGGSDNAETHLSTIAANKALPIQLSTDRAVDEPTWLLYLGELYTTKLTLPLRAAGTLPPNATLFIALDCVLNTADRAARDASRSSIHLLQEASEYPVEVFWRCESDVALADVMADPMHRSRDLVGTLQQLLDRVGEHDLVLWLRPGDEVRPELHMALKFHGAFKSDFVLIDMYFRDTGKIYPILFHAVDPVHADFVDYFWSRFGISGRQMREAFQLSTNTAGTLARGWLKSRAQHSPPKYLHICLPLINAKITNTDLQRARAELIPTGSPLSHLPLTTPSADPRVSVVICTKDNGFLLQQLVQKLLHESTILDVVLVSNNTTNAHALKTLEAFKTAPRVRVLRYDEPFNFSRQSNLGAAHARGDLLLFLNDDITPVSPDWLPRLLRWFDQPQRCIVGPLLIYPNQRVQHAGMHLGFNGVAGHTLRDAQLPDGDYGFLLAAPRQVSCLTGAAMMMHRSLFNDLNGFDPMLATYLQDVDFSMRAHQSGAALIVDPRAVLIHMESVSLKPSLSAPRVQRTRELEYEHFRIRWGDRILTDPWLNGLFEANDESLRTLKRY